LALQLATASFLRQKIGLLQALNARSESVCQTNEHIKQENLTLAGIRKGQVFLFMSDTGFEPVTSTV
jgi:hypothetical protein